MSNPIIRIHNTKTDEVIDREMTNEEFKAFKAERDAIANQEAEAAAKEAAKAAVLEKLGLSEQEAKLLLG